MFLFIAGVVLMTVTRLRMPRAVAIVVFALSGRRCSSTWVSTWLRTSSWRLLSPHHPWLADQLPYLPLVAVAAAALIGGVVLWLAWVRGLSLANRLLGRGLPVQVDATV